MDVYLLWYKRVDKYFTASGTMQICDMLFFSCMYASVCCITRHAILPQFPPSLFFSWIILDGMLMRLQIIAHLLL